MWRALQPFQKPTWPSRLRLPRHVARGRLAERFLQSGALEPGSHSAVESTLHVTCLDAGALVATVRLATSRHGIRRARILVIQDPMRAMLLVSRGRRSAPGVRWAIRQIAAVTLAAGVQLNARCGA